MKPFITTFLIIISLFISFRSGYADSASPSATIQRFVHPILGTERIDRIAVSPTMTAWGTAEGLLVQPSVGSETLWCASNSPILPGEFVGLSLRDIDIWAATRSPGSGHGIYRLAGAEWTNFRVGHHGILSNKTSSIYADPDGIVWIGFEDIGVNKWVGDLDPLNLFKDVTTKHGLLVGKVTAFLMQHTHLWVGTDVGISRCRFELESETGSHVDRWTTDNGFPARIISCIEPYGKEGIVAGTERGLAFWDGKTWTLFGAKDGLRVVPVKCIAVSGTSIWVGGFRGLQCWSPEKLSPLLTESDGLPATQIRALALASASNTATLTLLIGTELGAASLPFERTDK